MRRLTREQQREIAVIAAKRDEEIDLSEMPEVIDWSEAEVGKFYHPPKRPVTMRLDADVVEWLRVTGPVIRPRRTCFYGTPLHSTQAAKSGGKRRRA